MVAGYHDGTDPRLAAFFDGRYRLRANRVYHAGNSDVCKILFEILRRCDRGLFVPCPHCRGECTQCIIRHGFVLRKYFAAQRIRHRHDFAAVEITRAAFEQFIRRTLCKLDYFPVMVVNGGHKLSHAVERSFRNAGVFRLQSRFFQPECGCKIHKRTFRRFADRFLRFVGFRIGTERHRRCKQLFVTARGAHNRHSVLGQRACFVGADNLRTAESFNGCKLPYDGIAPAHFRNADRKRNCNNGCKPFRNCGNRKADRNHECVQNKVGRDAAFCRQKAEAEHKDAYADDNIRQNSAELAEFNLQRRLSALRFCECIRDLAHFGIHSRCGDNGIAPAVHDG